MGRGLSLAETKPASRVEHLLTRPLCLARFPVLVSFPFPPDTSLAPTP